MRAVIGLEQVHPIVLRAVTDVLQALVQVRGSLLQELIDTILRFTDWILFFIMPKRD